MFEKHWSSLYAGGKNGRIASTIFFVLISYNDFIYMPFTKYRTLYKLQICISTKRVFKGVMRTRFSTDSKCRGADKSLARPGRKQANVSVRMAWISFGALPCRKRNLMTDRVSMLLKSRASLTCFRACFFPGRAKDLSAPRYRYASLDDGDTFWEIRR